MTLEERARALLVANSRTAELAGRTYRYTVPSLTAYPFQWLWDSCFHAIVWARFDPERAKDELRSLLAWQRPDGSVPHVVFWDRERVRRGPWSWHWLESRTLAARPLATVHIQPPVLAQATARVVEASGDESFLAETLPALARWHRWLLEARDPDGDALVSVISQFETGLDFNPAYDEGIGALGKGPFAIQARARRVELWNKAVWRFDLERIFRRSSWHVEDVLVNALHGQALEALARLAARAHDAPLAAWAEARAAAVLDALVGRCWDADAGLFWNLVGPEERPARVRTVVSLAPLVLSGLPHELAARLVEHLTDPREFGTAYPVPAVAVSEPSFVPGTGIGRRRLIWRGPLSLNTNWLLVHGLRAHGFVGVAATIAARSRELVERHGFNEFFDPLTGRPVGAHDFGWATLAVDL